MKKMLILIRILTGSMEAVSLSSGTAELVCPHSTSAAFSFAKIVCDLLLCISKEPSSLHTGPLISVHHMRHVTAAGSQTLSEHS